MAIGHLLDSITASIPVSHTGDPGSIPGRGNSLSHSIFLPTVCFGILVCLRLHEISLHMKILTHCQNILESLRLNFP